jgi:hypothetical protein
MIKKMFSFSLLESGAAGQEAKSVKYPGVRDAVDGNTAIIHVEREASDAAGAYPITPSTQMGEYWAEEVAAGHLNISDKPLIFIEPESEHAAAGVTAGHVDDRSACRQLLVGAGRRLHARVALRRRRQAPALRAQHGLPRHHQGFAQRPCRPRRLPLRR